MVDYKLDALCRKVERIRMYYKSPISEIILGPPRYPSKNLEKVEKIFDQVLETMKKDLNKTLGPKKIERLRKEISKAEQMKADYQRRIVLWYELGKATFDRERRFITGYIDENQLKYNELHKLEGIYSDYNKGQGFTYLEKIRLKLRLYPTEEQILAHLSCKPEPRTNLEEHLALIMEQSAQAKKESPQNEIKRPPVLNHPVTEIYLLSPGNQVESGRSEEIKRPPVLNHLVTEIYLLSPGNQAESGRPEEKKRATKVLDEPERS